MLKVVTQYTYIGKTEDKLCMLRSILAQLHYKYEVLEWEKKGVPFRSHLYVPEVHPITKCPFHEREDETHILKVYLLLINKY